MSCTCVGHTHRNMPGNPNHCLTMRIKYEPGFNATTMEHMVAENPDIHISEFFCPCQRNPHHTAVLRATPDQRYEISCSGCKEVLCVSERGVKGVELNAFREIFEYHQREMSG
jgi:hypothetical protein